jgi:hypothetical protein
MGGEVVALLAPLLPVLFNRTADAFSRARRQHGAAKVDAADKFWALFQAHLAQNQLLASAFIDLARRPNDENARGVAASYLDLLFAQDSHLAGAGTRLIRAGRDMIVAGPGAAVGTGSGPVASGYGTAVGGDYTRITGYDPWERIRAARGPRRFVVLVGLAIAIIGFAIFISGIFSAGNSNTTGFPPNVIIGFVLFGAGGVVVTIASQLMGPRD